jgi:putative membrane protein
MRALLFFTGLGIALVCLAVDWPLPGPGMPFSEHMVRHTGLLLVAAPLMALGIRSGGRYDGEMAWISRTVSGRPFIAWMTGVGLMWVWHLPSLYNGMAMGGMNGRQLLDTTSILHGASMLAGGAIFSWPVIMPNPSLRLAPLKAVLYLSSACVFCSLLGLLITFAPAGTYIGVTASDQQTGGLIMWVPCCLIYLSASMYLLVKWFSLSDKASPAQV